jgi:hypothetical protein
MIKCVLMRYRLLKFIIFNTYKDSISKFSIDHKIEYIRQIYRGSTFSPLALISKYFLFNKYCLYYGA